MLETRGRARTAAPDGGLTVPELRGRVQRLRLRGARFSVCSRRSSSSKLIGRPTMKPWALVAAHGPQLLEAVRVLDAFGDDGAAERVGEGDGRLDHDQVGAVVAHRLDEALVDLDLARRDLLQIVERRQAGAVIVDRNLDPQLAQRRPAGRRRCRCPTPRRSRSAPGQPVGRQPVARRGWPRPGRAGRGR